MENGQREVPDEDGSHNCRCSHVTEMLSAKLDPSLDPEVIDNNIVLDGHSTCHQRDQLAIQPGCEQGVERSVFDGTSTAEYLVENVQNAVDLKNDNGPVMKGARCCCTNSKACKMLATTRCDSKTITSLNLPRQQTCLRDDDENVCESNNILNIKSESVFSNGENKAVCKKDCLQASREAESQEPRTSKNSEIVGLRVDRIVESQDALQPARNSREQFATEDVVIRHLSNQVQPGLPNSENAGLHVVRIALGQSQGALLPTQNSREQFATEEIVLRTPSNQVQTVPNSANIESDVEAITESQGALTPPQHMQQKFASEEEVRTPSKRIQPLQDSEHSAVQTRSSGKSQESLKSPQQLASTDVIFYPSKQALLKQKNSTDTEILLESRAEAASLPRRQQQSAGAVNNNGSPRSQSAAKTSTEESLHSGSGSKHRATQAAKLHVGVRSLRKYREFSRGSGKHIFKVCI